MAESTKEKIALDVEIASPEFFDHMKYILEDSEKEKEKDKEIERVQNLMAAAFKEVYGELLAMASEYLQKNADAKKELIDLYNECRPLSYNATKLYVVLPINIFSAPFETTLDLVKIGTVLLMALSTNEGLQIQLANGIPQTNETYRKKVGDILCGLMTDLKPVMLNSLENGDLDDIVDFFLKREADYRKLTSNQYGEMCKLATEVIALNIMSSLDGYKSDDSLKVAYSVTAHILYKCMNLEKWQYKVRIAKNTGKKSEIWNKDLWDITKIKDFKMLAHFYDDNKKAEIRDLMMATYYDDKDIFPFDMLIPNTYLSLANMMIAFTGNLMGDLSYTKKERIKILHYILASSRSAFADGRRWIDEQDGEDTSPDKNGYILSGAGKEIKDAEMMGYKTDTIASAMMFYGLLKTVKSCRIEDILYYLRREANITKDAVNNVDILMQQNVKAEEKNRELEEKYKRIIGEKDAAIEKYRKAEMADSGAKGHIERLEQDKKELEEECKILRELLEESERENPEVKKSIEVEETIPDDKVCQLISNASRKYKIFIIGGNANLMKKVIVKYPDLSCYHMKKIGEWDGMLTDADLILFKTDCLGHTYYSKAKSISMAKKIPYKYLKTVTSMELLERDIVDKLVESGLVTESDIEEVMKDASVQ